MIRLNIQDKGIYKIIVKMQNKELFLKRVFLAVKPTPDVNFIYMPTVLFAPSCPHS